MEGRKGGKTPLNGPMGRPQARQNSTIIRSVLTVGSLKNKPSSFQCVPRLRTIINLYRVTKPSYSVVNLGGILIIEPYI